jgi:hypothetical protein
MHFLIRKNENLPVDPVGKALSYFNWEESVKRTVYGLVNTLIIPTLLLFEMAKSACSPFC